MDIKEAASLLGFEPGATIREEDIVAAYKAKAKTAHPDMGGSDEEFRTLTLAYNTLREAVKRPAPLGKRIHSRCSTCNGSGIVDTRRASWRTLKVRCPQCKGTGASQG
jgi:DnaJ-class molecular chaperone